MSQIVKHRKSNILDKVPNQSGMTYGEIFVNYASGNGKSFLATKKTDNTVAQFMEKSYNDATYSTKAEASEYAAVALANAKNYTNNVSGNIETTINNVSASIISYVSNGYSTTGALATANSKISALSGVVSSIAETYATKNEFQSFSASVLSEIENDEYTTSLALTTLNQNFDSLSSTVYTEINGLSADITTANSKISALSGVVSSIAETYATKNEFQSFSASVLSEIENDEYTTSLALTTLNQNFDSLSSTVYTEINGLSADITTANSKISALSGVVSSIAETYATKNEFQSFSASVLSEIENDEYTTSLALTTLNQNFDSLSSTVYTEINELSADITTANSKISELSGTVSSFTLIYPTKAEASEYAAAALANAYSDIIYLSGVINTLVSQISNIENILSAQT